MSVCHYPVFVWIVLVDADERIHPIIREKDTSLCFVVMIGNKL